MKHFKSCHIWETWSNSCCSTPDFQMRMSNWPGPLLVQWAWKAISEKEESWVKSCKNSSWPLLSFHFPDVRGIQKYCKAKATLGIWGSPLECCFHYFNQFLLKTAYSLVHTQWNDIILNENPLIKILQMRLNEHKAI